MRGQSTGTQELIRVSSPETFLGLPHVGTTDRLIVYLLGLRPQPQVPRFWADVMLLKAQVTYHAVGLPGMASPPLRLPAALTLGHLMRENY